MRVVCDQLSREWTISVNVHSLARIRGTTGINLYDISPGPDGMTSVQKVLTDGLTFGLVLGALLGPQIKSQGLDEESFFRTVDQPALEQMHRCFIEEWVDFFQSSSQGGRRAMARLIRDMFDVLERVRSRANEKIEAMPLPQIDPEQVAESIWNKRSTSSPESSESTPAPTPGGN